MKSAQFVRGKIDGIQKRFESPGTDTIISTEKLNDLKDYDVVGDIQQFYRKGRALIRTVIIPAENTDHRRGGIINHTVIYVWDANLNHEDANYIFDLDTFVSQVLDGKRKFKMPPMPNLPDSDSGVIDAPPPIEWEVEQ